jgi:hypothetical protein
MRSMVLVSRMLASSVPLALQCKASSSLLASKNRSSIVRVAFYLRSQRSVRALLFVGGKSNYGLGVGAQSKSFYDDLARQAAATGICFDTIAFRGDSGIAETRSLSEFTGGNIWFYESPEESGASLPQEL